MRARMCFVILVGLLACGGCKTKSTDDLIGDLKSGGGRERIAAVRLLPRRQASCRAPRATVRRTTFWTRPFTHSSKAPLSAPFDWAHRIAFQYRSSTNPYSSTSSRSSNAFDRRRARD